MDTFKKIHFVRYDDLCNSINKSHISCFYDDRDIYGSLCFDKYDASYGVNVGLDILLFLLLFLLCSLIITAIHDFSTATRIW